MPLSQRRAAKTSMRREQTQWLARLTSLVEPPRPGEDFPAFLLATPAFEDLARRIGQAKTRADLQPQVADELDWFVNAFRDYLVTDVGEDVFAGRHR